MVIAYLSILKEFQWETSHGYIVEIRQACLPWKLQWQIYRYHMLFQEVFPCKHMSSAPQRKKNIVYLSLSEWAN